MGGLVNLPPLRQELALHPGPQASDGSPTWTLHDPATNRFFALSWPAFEILSRWSMGHAGDILAAIQAHTTLRVTQDELQDLLRMLQANHLLVAGNSEDTERLGGQARAARLAPLQWLLKHYLFFRVPLLRPMGWLQRTSPSLRWAFRPAFWLGMAAITLLGLVLAARRWDEFSHTITTYASWEGLLAIGIALSAAKLVHELGHAFTATHFGCRVPTMGVAFLVMWPVLYTDTNEAWKLSSRRQRLYIGAAGMLSELALASLALLAWSLLPDSPGWAPIRSGAFLLATTTWVLTITVNASPFMRFDGYFLLADAVNLPNLHERSFALGRWWLREQLFGWNALPPEHFSPRRQAALVLFAFATWLYRLVLFFGIALLVYHAFFKLLGLMLMTVELVWFIARPVLLELRHWWAQRQQLHWNPSVRRSAILCALLMLLLCWPWAGVTRLPAVLSPDQMQTVSSAYAARVESFNIRVGQGVEAGQLLMQLHSPELEMQLQQAQLQEQQLQIQLLQQAFDDKLREQGPALRKQWEQAFVQVRGLQEQKERLAVRAPFAGHVAELADDLRPGQWITAGERLLSVAGRQGSKLDAYADEAALEELRSGMPARFIPAAGGSAVTCTLGRIAPVQLATLDEPAAADLYGGSVAVQRGPDGRLLPLHPIFHLRLEHCQQERPPTVALYGTVHLQTPRASWLGYSMRWLVGRLQSEIAL